MTHEYHYLKCTDCEACNLIDAERCWYCEGKELEERVATWAVPEPVS